MKPRQENFGPLVEPGEIAQIELYILKRMRERSAGGHASTGVGTGFDVCGLRDWEPGDAVSAIDWAQSSMTNFSPLVTRQFEQESNATIVALADASMSTRCGPPGATVMIAIARAMAAIGFAAAVLQDRFGFVAFGDAGCPVASAVPRAGRSHVLHCLGLYEHSPGRRQGADDSDLVGALAGCLRRPSLIPVISDFLFDGAESLLAALERLVAAHDVLLVMVDAGAAFELPPTSAGWVEVFDVETGRARTLSRRELAQLRERVAAWQDRIGALARNRGLDIVRLNADRQKVQDTMLQLVAERRARRMQQAS